MLLSSTSQFNEELNQINEKYNQNDTNALRNEINENHIVNSNIIKNDKIENIENSIYSQVTNCFRNNENENYNGNQNDNIRNENGVIISKNDNIQENQNNKEKIIINENNSYEKYYFQENKENDEDNKEEEEYQIKNGNSIKRINNKDINNINIIRNNNQNEVLPISEIDEDENNDISFSHLISETKEIYYPKGIKNLGLSCYMNSLLQCLFNITELREHFIKELEKKKIDKKAKPVSYYFALVMYDLLYTNKDYIIPHYFKSEISKINKLFKKNKPADVTDLFRNLIDSFLTELSIDNEERTESVSYAPFDKKAILNEIKKEIKNNFFSILKVYNLTKYFCPSNNHKNKYEYNYESDSNITFFLENIIQYKKDKNSAITLRECFEYLQREKKNNQFYCSQCKNTVNGKSYEKIVFPPEILVIILNRGKGKKVKNEVKIETLLDFSDFIDEKENKKDIYYKLIGCCNHYGDSSPTGHYTATCFYED